MDGMTITAAVTFLGLIGSWLLLPGNGTVTQSASAAAETVHGAAKA